MGQVVDQPEFDREVDEGAGRLDDAAIVAQPHQRLDAVDLLGADVDLGLERAAEPLVENRQPQRLFDLHALLRLALHRHVEDRDAALGGVLDLVHRDVGILPQRLEAAAVLGIQADADRGGGEHFRSVDVERRAQPLLQEIDVVGDFGLAGDRAQQHQELVAADPRQRVGGAQFVADPLGELDQQGVADGVAVIVVDVLEIVDVEKRQRETGLGLQQAVGAGLDHGAVRQPGQFVEIGALEQRLLDLPSGR